MEQTLLPFNLHDCLKYHDTLKKIDVKCFFFFVFWLIRFYNLYFQGVSLQEQGLKTCFCLLSSKWKFRFLHTQRIPEAGFWKKSANIEGH